MIYLVIENLYRIAKNLVSSLSLSFFFVSRTRLVHGDSARGIKRLNRGNTWHRRPLFTLSHRKYRYTVCQKPCGTICCPKIFFIGRWIIDSTDINETFDFKRNQVYYTINKETKLVECLLLYLISLISENIDNFLRWFFLRWICRSKYNFINVPLIIIDDRSLKIIS